MYNIAQKLINRITMQKKIDNDIKTGKYFSGAGFIIEVYKGGDLTKEPDYCIETGSPELSEELVELLSKINKDSLLFCKGLAKSKMKELTNALAEYSDYEKEIGPEKDNTG